MKRFVKILSATAVSATVVAMCLTGCSGGNNGITVSGKDSCEISVEGINGKGTVSLSLDDDKFDTVAVSLYGDPDNIPPNQYTQYLEAYSKFKSAVNSMDYSIVSDKKENFSNGDVIKIKLSYNEKKLQEAGINISDPEFDYTISGLTEATNIDPFDGLKVEFTGISPNVKTQIDTSGCNEYVRNNVNFIMDRNDGSLANGEKINITIYYDEYKAEQNAVNITSTSKEYTVEGALEYPANLNGVNLTEIENQFNDMLESALSEHKIYVGYKGNLPDDWSAEGQITKVEPKIVLKAYLNSKNNTSYVSYHNEYDCYWEINVTMKCTDKGYSDDHRVGEIINYKYYYVADIQDIPVDTNKSIPQEYLNNYKDEFYSDVDTTYQEVYNNWIVANKAKYNIIEMPVTNTSTTSEPSEETSKETSAQTSSKPENSTQPSKAESSAESSH